MAVGKSKQLSYRKELHPLTRATGSPFRPAEFHLKGTSEAQDFAGSLIGHPNLVSGVTLGEETIIISKSTRAADIIETMLKKGKYPRPTRLTNALEPSDDVVISTRL